MSPAPSPRTEEADEFLSALALVSTAAATMCLSLVVALLVARSGLGTPPRLVVLCSAIVLASAYAPFLVPRSLYVRLNGARFVSPLLMTAVMFSPLLCRAGPWWLGHVYILMGVFGAIRAMPHLARTGWRPLSAVVVACVVLGFHLFTAQGVHASAVLPELMALGRFSGDPYLHAAIASMIRYHGVASTGVDGAVPFHYHAGSHHWFAAIGSIADADSAYAYLVGRTVFMLPSLYLALFVAALLLRRSRPQDAPFLVITTAAVSILIDGAKLDLYTYRSESEVFGIIVLLLALPLLDDAVIRSERAGPAHWLRLLPWPLVVFLAGWIKASVGALLAVVAFYALARTWSRAPVTIGAMSAVAFAAVLSLRGSGGGLTEFLAIRPLGFLLYRDRVFVALSLVFAYALAAAVVLPRFWPRAARDPSRPRGHFWRGGAIPLSWEELVLVIAAAAAVPVLLVSGFVGWYFVDAVFWFTLAVVLARLTRVDATQLWRSVISARCGFIALGLLVAMSAAPVFRAFSPGDLIGVTMEMLSGLEREAEPGRALRPDGEAAVRRFFGQSLIREHVLFGSEFVGALRKSYGVRMVELIRRVADQEGRAGLGVFVPPDNVRFWRYSVDCRSQPLFVPALAGVPMVRGLPPVVEGCALPRTFGYADYGASSRSVEGDAAELCRHARGRGLRRVLVLRDVDAPAANTVLRCEDDR